METGAPVEVLRRGSVRARIIDRDDQPRWRPADIGEVRIEGLEL